MPEMASSQNSPPPSSSTTTPTPTPTPTPHLITLSNVDAKHLPRHHSKLEKELASFSTLQASPKAKASKKRVARKRLVATARTTGVEMEKMLLELRRKTWIGRPLDHDCDDCGDDDDDGTTTAAATDTDDDDTAAAAAVAATDTDDDDDDTAAGATDTDDDDNHPHPDHSEVDSLLAWAFLGERSIHILESQLGESLPLSADLRVATAEVWTMLYAAGAVGGGEMSIEVSEWVERIRGWLEGVVGDPSVDAATRARAHGVRGRVLWTEGRKEDAVGEVGVGLDLVGSSKKSGVPVFVALLEQRAEMLVALGKEGEALVDVRAAVGSLNSATWWGLNKKVEHLVRAHLAVGVLLAHSGGRGGGESQDHLLAAWKRVLELLDGYTAHRETFPELWASRLLGCLRALLSQMDPDLLSLVSDESAPNLGYEIELGTPWWVPPCEYNNNNNNDDDGGIQGGLVVLMSGVMQFISSRMSRKEEVPSGDPYALPQLAREAAVLLSSKYLEADTSPEDLMVAWEKVGDAYASIPDEKRALDGYTRALDSRLEEVGGRDRFRLYYKMSTMSPSDDVEYRNKALGLVVQDESVADGGPLADMAASLFLGRAAEAMRNGNEISVEGVRVEDAKADAVRALGVARKSGKGPVGRYVTQAAELLVALCEKTGGSSGGGSSGGGGGGGVLELAIAHYLELEEYYALRGMGDEASVAMERADELRARL